MVAILSIFTLPFLFPFIVVGQNCNEAIEGWVNGCSIPFGIDFFYKERFKLACNKHDHCYNCARHADFLKTRAFCDDQFKANMKKTCNQIQNPLIRGPCTMFAKLYFKAVHKLGVFFFEQKPPPYCSSTWKTLKLATIFQLLKPQTDNDQDWFKAVQAMSILGFLVLIVAVVMTVLKLFVMKDNKPALFAGIGTSFAGDVLCQRRSPTPPPSLKFAYLSFFESIFEIQEYVENFFLRVAL
uniref:Conodipine-M alpha chain n=1 Tax=Magallana gigas TaxID=29159 RepID=K1Q895_MAGGI